MFPTIKYSTSKFCGIHCRVLPLQAETNSNAMLKTEYSGVCSPCFIGTFVFSVLLFVAANCHFPVRLKPHKFRRIENDCHQTQCETNYQKHFCEWKWRNI